ncbi:alpha/beta hydrolase [Paraferrimonas sedimenticola]|uniref:Alpha/beta hydrolase n=1 Tax=Paraferrimonas sedimenticola TaxID=375674 RepID=A0AA37RW58_9GAMM|nr:alpha/beta hydrolase [Paraferrimonas sedimenticola]GLP95887.1 alpha/beta hydrolase [Paraferrimonas sedimenticola]
MPSWRAKALNKLLFRLIRSRLVQCEDILSLRAVIASLERLSGYVMPISEQEMISDWIGGVPCHWLSLDTPSSDSLIVYFHGGGFCFRSPLFHNALLARLCQQSHCRGVMVNYRLAPEFPFPASVHDCFNFYQDLLEQGFNPNKLILAGDSAGANLVLTTMMQARDSGLPQPAGAILISPTVDQTLNSDSAFVMRNADPFFDIGALLLMRMSYLNGHDPSDPLCSPMYDTLEGLAPMMIHVGSLEILLDDSVRLANKVKRARGVADLTIWPELPHVFPVFYQLPEAQEAIRRMVRFIGQQVAAAAKATDYSSSA